MYEGQNYINKHLIDGLLSIDNSPALGCAKKSLAIQYMQREPSLVEETLAGRNATARYQGLFCLRVCQSLRRSKWIMKTFCSVFSGIYSQTSRVFAAEQKSFLVSVLFL